MKRYTGMKKLAASCQAVLCAGVMAMSAVSAWQTGGVTAAAETKLPGSESVYSLTAQKAEQGVALKWKSVENALDYVIYRALCAEDGSAGAFKKIAVTRGTEYTDLSAVGNGGKMYVYKIAPRFKESGAPVLGEYSEEVYSYGGVIIRENTTERYDDVTCGEGYEIEPGVAVDGYGCGDVLDDPYDEEGSEVMPGEGLAGEGDVLDGDYEDDIMEEPDMDFAPAPEGGYDSAAAVTAGTLTAGEWKDNENFEEYRKLVMGESWARQCGDFGIKTSRRYTVKVTDSKGANAENALVTLKAGGRVLAKARTNNKGVAYIFYNINGRNESPSVMEITSGEERRRIRISRKEETCRSFNVSLGGEYKAPEKALDLMFMIDTTGSMGDELEYLQAEFLDVIARVDEANPDLDKRVSMNFYRDEGDEYILRSFDFTDDMKKASKQLSAQRAGGGGDYPEAVDKALGNAVNGHTWRKDSVKIMFMVLDAPSHSSKEITRSLVRSMETAAEKGIRIIPIVSSGAEFDVEYQMRSAAVITGGTYVFLTDDSGVGYSHLAPSLPEETDKEKLNELMIRVINEYLE